MKAVEVSFENDEAEVRFAPDKIALDAVFEKIKKCGYTTGLKAPLVLVVRKGTVEIQTQSESNELLPGKAGTMIVTIRPMGKDTKLVAKEGVSVRLEVKAPEGVSFKTDKDDAPKSSVLVTSSEEGTDQRKLTLSIVVDAKAVPGLSQLESKLRVNLSSGEETIDVLIPVFVGGGK